MHNVVVWSGPVAVAVAAILALADDTVAAVHRMSVPQPAQWAAGDRALVAAQPARLPGPLCPRSVPMARFSCSSTERAATGH